MILNNKIVKLINQRGRIVDVPEFQVQKLLLKGFMRAPDQPHSYNPVFDKAGQPAIPKKQLEETPKIIREKMEVDII